LFLYTALLIAACEYFNCNLRIGILLLILIFSNCKFLIRKDLYETKLPLHRYFSVHLVL